MKRTPPYTVITLVSTLLFFLTAYGNAAESDSEPPASDGSRDSVNARADYFRLDSDYNPPPGEALHHYTAGYAKILCSAVFITGLDPDDAIANVGGFISPFDQRQHVVDTRIDHEQQLVALTLSDGVTRVARRYGSQGCVTRPMGEETMQFTPSIIEPNLPPAGSIPWPMGDSMSNAPWPAGVN